MAKALATAQVQSVREITKKADIKKTNKKVTVFVLTLLISIMVIYISYLGYNYYVNSRFEYKESELGVNFYAKDFGVNDSLNKILMDSNILISVNINEKDLNQTDQITESVVLFNTILSSKNKFTITIINVLDNTGNLINCTTNKGDVYTNEQLDAVSCKDILNSSNSTIIIYFPNANLKESAVYLSPTDKKLEIKPKTERDLMVSTYLVLKSEYPDLEETLSQVEAIKNKLGDMNSIKDLDTNN